MLISVTLGRPRGKIKALLAYFLTEANKVNKQNKGQEIVERLAEKTALKLYRIGCDEKNFEIINKLPLTASEIEKEFRLTAMPVNKRIKELAEVGLVFREKRGEKIQRTNMANEFIKQINELRNEVVLNMAKLIE